LPAWRPLKGRKEKKYGCGRHEAFLSGEERMTGKEKKSTLHASCDDWGRKRKESIVNHLQGKKEKKEERAGVASAREEGKRGGPPFQPFRREKKKKRIRGI